MKYMGALHIWYTNKKTCILCYISRDTGENVSCSETKRLDQLVTEFQLATGDLKITISFTPLLHFIVLT